MAAEKGEHADGEDWQDRKNKRKKKRDLKQTAD